MFSENASHLSNAQRHRQKFRCACGTHGESPVEERNDVNRLNRRVTLEQTLQSYPRPQMPAGIKTTPSRNEKKQQFRNSATTSVSTLSYQLTANTPIHPKTAHDTAKSPCNLSTYAKPQRHPPHLRTASRLPQANFPACARPAMHTSLRTARQAHRHTSDGRAGGRVG